MPLAKEKGVEVVAACGPFGRAIAEGAGENGKWFPTSTEMKAALPELLRRDDSVLVKASLGMHMDVIAEAVKELKLP